jgi:hypothetical protein
MKNNMKWLSLIFVLFYTTGFAQVRPELFQEEENFEKLSNDEFREKKDITLRDESIISDTNVYTGIKDFEYYTENSIVFEHCSHCGNYDHKYVYKKINITNDNETDI